MLDSLGRTIDYARVSVTDRCNLRCRYCMPEEGVGKKRHEDILSFADIRRVVACFAELGIRRLKITGGEPLVRRDVVGLVRSLGEVPGIESVTLTTNGILLPGAARELREAGLGGVNVSLDTLDPEQYRELTRGGDVGRVLAGIDAALAAGLPSVKVNCVPMAATGADGLGRIAALARERPVHVRFIELMPMGAGAQFAAIERGRVREAVESAFGRLRPCAEKLGNGPAEYFSLPGFVGRIGFVDTLDHGLCGRCNRLRLTADGVLKACLHMDAGTDLRPALAESSDGALLAAVSGAIRAKPAHHRFSLPGAPGSDRRGMSQIGG